MLHYLNLVPSVEAATAHSLITSDNNTATDGAAPLTHDKIDLDALPLVTFRAGETVIASGSKTGRLLILRKGTVAILKDSTEIARVGEPGAIFGELSLLLDLPHTADVRAVETSQLHVANANTLLSRHPIVFRYVATVLASRLDAANRALIQLRGQLQAGQSRSAVADTMSKMEGLLAASGANLLYAGYPFDPFA